MCELERRPRVIVESAHQPVVYMKLDTYGAQNFLQRFEVFAGILAEELGNAGQSFDDRLSPRHLAFKYAQRILHRPPLAVVAHFSDNRVQRLAQRLVELSAIGGSAARNLFPISIPDARPGPQ